MAIDFDALDLVRSENKSRSYNTKLDGLQQQVTELQELVAQIKKHLVVNIEEDATSENYELRADSADLLHKIEKKENKIKNLLWLN